MAKARWGGKEKIIVYLMEKEGYSHAKSMKLVNQVISIIKKALSENKDVELEGIGKLLIKKYPTRRVIERNINCVPTIMTKFDRKTVILKRSLVLEDLNE